MRTHPSTARAEIEQLIDSSSTPIPLPLREAFYQFQFKHHARFLLVINLLGHIAYFSYVLADALVVPDVFELSLAIRSAFLLLTLPLVMALFRYSRNVRLLDMVLPFMVLLASVAWVVMMAQSHSPNVATYQYASVIFIVLANLCVRVRFLPALVTSLLIAAVTLVGVTLFNPGEPQAVMVFALVYLPVLLFSLFISWSNTLAGRRAYLHAVLDEQTHQALSIANAKLEALASTDSLTGIGNRRQFDALAQRYWYGHQHSGKGFAVLLADIDYFKHYNDHYGHPAGDDCLVQVAQLLASSLREGEHFVGRYGGEEFAILVTASAPVTVAQIAERLVLATRKLAIAHVHRPDHLGTVSISIGAALATEADSLEALIQQADERLYQAKRQGRNQVCATTPTSTASSPPCASAGMAPSMAITPA